ELPSELRLERPPEPTKVFTCSAVGRNPVLVAANLVCPISRRLSNRFQFVDRGRHREALRSKQCRVVELGEAMDVERNGILLILEGSEPPHRGIPVLLLDARGCQLLRSQRRERALARE